MSQHLECRLKPQVLNRLVLGKLRRFVMKRVLLRQYVDLQPAQAALRYRFLRGAAQKAPDCGRGNRPKKPSQTPFVSKPHDFFGLGSEP